MSGETAFLTPTTALMRALLESFHREIDFGSVMFKATCFASWTIGATATRQVERYGDEQREMNKEKEKERDEQRERKR